MFENSTASGNMSLGRRNAYFEKIQRDSAKNSARNSIGDCLSDASKTQQEMAACLSDARAAITSELAHYTGGGNSSFEVKKRARRNQELQKDATRDALGDVFSRCVKQGGKRNTCLAELQNSSDAAGLGGEDPETIMKRSFSRALQSPSSNCSGDLKTCREEARAEAISQGMKPREYASVKSMGEVRAPAEFWASCMDAGTDDAECEGGAKDEFISVSGARDSDFSTELLDRIKSLGQAIRNGDPVTAVRLPRMHVTVHTSGNACNATIEDLFRVIAMRLARANHSSVSGAKKQKCRMVDGTPEYHTLVDADIQNSEFDPLSDAMAWSGMLATLSVVCSP